MIGGRAGHGQELNVPPRLSRRGTQEGLEIRRRQQSRARAGQKQTAGLDQAHAKHVEIEVFPLARGNLVAVGDQLGWIENDDAVSTLD